MSDARLHALGQGRGGDPASCEVLVVGGGLAGTAAALALARTGYRVTLLEAKSRLGGRAGSYIDPQSGDAIDYCQHVGMQCCSSLRQFLAWLGQEALWRVESELHFYGPDETYRRLRALPLLPAPVHLAGWLWGWPGLSWLDRARIAYAMAALDRIQLTPQREAELDRTSALQWLRARWQTPRTLERFWSTVLVSALGEELSRVNLLSVAKVFQDGFLRHREAYQLLIPTRPLRELFGGNAEQALRDAGVELCLGQPVKRLEWAASQACVAAVLSDGRCVPCQRVVLAVPWHAMGGLLQDSPCDWAGELAAGAAGLESSPISGVHTWWDRAWLPTPHAVLVGRLCQWVFPPLERAAEQPGERGEHYYQIVISASRQLPRGSASEVGAQIQADLAEVFPQVREAKLLRVKVVTDPDAVFSVQPGSTALRPVCHPGSNVWVAGDWTRTGWPATMESAILSGLNVAKSLDDAAGRIPRLSNRGQRGS
jgi:squalene-associated FAD-dependent desaturase